MSRYIAAIDQGTTSTRCILFDRDSNPVASAQREHEQVFPRPGWVEHDPLEIWHRTEEVVAGAIRAAGAQVGEIAAIGVANQRETSVFWDRQTGLPLCNAIVWQDTRTKDLCDALAGDHGDHGDHGARGIDRFRQRVGLPLATYFSGPKIRWAIDNIPAVAHAVRERRAAFGTVDSWLIWNLTGGAAHGGAHVIDVTNASRTMLMNLATLEWDDVMLDALRVPREILPRIVPSSDPKGWGATSRDGAFGDAIRVCGDLGDQHAALVGQACFTAGESKNTYGTGCFMLLHTGETPAISKAGLLSTVAYKFGDSRACYALEGSIAVTGSLVQWLRDNLGIIRASNEVESLAASVDDNGGVYIVPAFSGLFTPHWRSDARGVIVGLTRQSNRGHLARAALEATAFQTRDVVGAMLADCDDLKLARLKVDGGMCVNDALMQFQADLLDVPVVRPKVIETTALGAAYAAGLAVGFWKDLQELRANWKEDKTWRSTMKPQVREKLCGDWRKAVQRSFAWVE